MAPNECPEEKHASGHPKLTATTDHNRCIQVFTMFERLVLEHDSKFLALYLHGCTSVLTSLFVY